MKEHWRTGGAGEDWRSRREQEEKRRTRTARRATGIGEKRRSRRDWMSRRGQQGDKDIGRREQQEGQHEKGKDWSGRGGL
jgi:hypothetical protein